MRMSIALKRLASCVSLLYAKASTWWSIHGDDIANVLGDSDWSTGGQPFPIGWREQPYLEPREKP